MLKLQGISQDVVKYMCLAIFFLRDVFVVAVHAQWISNGLGPVETKVP